jgi:hypothetical protein
VEVWGNSAGGSFENDGSMFADDGGILELGVNSATVGIGVGPQIKPILPVTLPLARLPERA